MTFSEYSALSVSDARVLTQINIGNLNKQFVNAGSGIWKLNMDGLYPEVDPLLLEGFTAQNFGDVGAVTVDGIPYTEAASLLALTGDTEAYYWDLAGKNLYVCLIDYDEPWLHNIFLGIIHGYSFDEFEPVGLNQLYEGRLTGSPTISQSRDPLFWGKMQYSLGGVSFINSDKEFDTFADSEDIYGNEVNFLFGYKQLDISDYINIYSGSIGDIETSEEEMQLSFVDKRFSLTKAIQYTCVAKNALDAIVEILATSYGVQYDETYYDTTAWATATAFVPVITIRMQEEGSTIDLIEEICGSIFGLFIILPDNRFSFKIVDTSAAALITIPGTDILNHHTISYKTSEVVSSVAVGYNKNWSSDYVSPYTWLTDTSREDAIYLKYKTYNQKKYYTLLTNLTDAQAFSNTILDYAQDVHASGVATVPMKYYSYEVADIVNIEINREKTTMLGTKKCEITSKQYNLKEANITFGYRVV